MKGEERKGEKRKERWRQLIYCSALSSFSKFKLGEMWNCECYCASDSVIWKSCPPQRGRHKFDFGLKYTVVSDIVYDTETNTTYGVRRHYGSCHSKLQTRVTTSCDS